MALEKGYDTKSVAIATGRDKGPPGGMLATMVSTCRKVSCDGYRGQLRINMVLFWLQELSEDHKGGFCGHKVRHGLL